MCYFRLVEPPDLHTSFGAKDKLFISSMNVNSLGDQLPVPKLCCLRGHLRVS